MTYILPNFFLHNNNKNLTKIDNIFCLNYSSSKHIENISIRTTMHCMIVLLHGNKTISFKDKNIDMCSSEMCFLAQNNYYMSEKTAKDNSYKSLIVYFDDDFIFNFLQKYNIKLNKTHKNNIVKLEYLDDNMLNDNILSLQEYIKRKLDNTFLKLKIEEIFLHSLRIKNTEFLLFLYTITSTSKDRIKFILHSNLDLIQTLDDMYTLTRLTQNQLRRYIKNKHNTTPKVWLDAQRLQKATLLLKNTDKTITDIATQCGYSTVSWFISQFKKKYNKTPKEFRYKT